MSEYPIGDFGKWSYAGRSSTYALALKKAELLRRGGSMRNKKSSSIRAVVRKTRDFKTNKVVYEVYVRYFQYYRG